ncbi:hypothetical protein C8J26_3102 [Sphingomonas aurantiaca]|uniref:Uncharacterized protein n=1 Tax=Sphingomonas aurantiaca TaxID=185949 RepID=A0A2T5GJ50_9SPHN|nr:hypothetical protein [Sphingomonas aurantiaca]PTQ59358.1 hypothetical protein C8J26_3102 [Sphingomonas aurantiaca]
MTAETHSPERSPRGDVFTASGIAVLIVLMLVMVMHHPAARQADARHPPIAWFMERWQRQ